MAALPYIQLYVADYLADTAHLTVTASGAYLHLLMNYWQTGKALKNDDSRLALIAKCYGGEWPNIKDDVLEFFDNRDGLLYHKRIEADLKKVNGKGRADEGLIGEWKGYVYFISTDSADKVKVGYSKNPWARIKDMQTSSSELLLLLATIKTTDISEKKLHKEIEEYLINGEWYSLSPLLSDLILSIKNKKTTTLSDCIDYCRNYGITTIVTTKDTDTDTDTDTEKNTTSGQKKPVLNKFSVTDILSFGIELGVANDFIIHRKNKKSPLTKTAWNGIVREIGKSGLSIKDGISMIMERGWTGFKAEWVNGTPKTQHQLTPRPTARQAYMMDVGNLLKEMNGVNNGNNISAGAEGPLLIPPPLS